jgi:glycyl-tRNA synthetase
VEIKNFQEFIIALCNYWVDYGCIWSQPYDANMGAGTFHPHTFLKGVGPEPWRSVYVQPCRRPVDGRYGKSPYRFQHYYQLQVLLKPSPSNIVDIFLKSLEHVGINLKENDIGLLEDDWKGPTLGAWGLGWEIRANGQEVTQFTYFQQLGGQDIDVVCGEITYGLERLFMYSKGYNNALDMPFNDQFTYGDIFFQNEFEFSSFNFIEADTQQLFKYFEVCEEKVMALCEKNLVLPAYDYVLQASHCFNLLDARGAISVSERQRYIGRVRDCARKCALKYRASREKLGFPLLNRLDNDARKPLFSNKLNNPKKLEFNETQLYNNINQFSSSQSLNILFELGVEEMPPAFQVSAKAQLESKVAEFVAKENLNWALFHDTLAKEHASYSIEISSRRLSILFKNIPKTENSKTLEIWGPAERIAKASDGSLSQAGLGFCKKNNIDPLRVQFKSKNEGVFMYSEKFLEGRDFPTILAEKFKEWCYAFSAPLMMKWLPQDISPTFIRPVRWIVALVEDKVIPLNMFGLTASRLTCGQRILHPESLPIEHVNDYFKVLNNIFVKPFIKERNSIILNNAKKLAAEKNGKVQIDNSLLDKCVGLYENPYVFIAEFEEKYLRLPKPLISSVLKEHMNYFSVASLNNEKLLPYYIGVANYKCNNLQEMIEGTKTVVVGRLEDGAFYYDTDLKTPLAELRDKLQHQLFQAGMGSLFDKTERIKKLVSHLCILLQLTKQKEILETAAAFCKADLKTGCVQEFPDEMQGIMGGILLKEQNVFNDTYKSEIAAKAVEEHYLPLGAQSPLPTTIEGVVLALADKLDSLCLMFSHGAEMKAGKDPLGMRRLALGVVRLLGIRNENNSIALPLKDVLNLTFQVIEEEKQVKVTIESRHKTNLFIIDRIKAALEDEFDIRLIEALSRQLLEEPFSKVRLFAVEMTNALKKTGEGSLQNALLPYKRAKNLTYNWNDTAINTKLFKASAEFLLYETLQNIENIIKTQLQNSQYQEVFNTLASLAEPLSEFFETVMVNDPDEALKRNRLNLLTKICSLYENVANFSCIQVQ